MHQHEKADQMKKFNNWIEERDLQEGLLGMAKGLFAGKKREPGVPYDGDPLTIFNIYIDEHGRRLISGTTEGALLMGKDGSVSIRHENGIASKTEFRRDSLKPHRHGWKIERLLKQ